MRLPIAISTCLSPIFSTSMNYMLSRLFDWSSGGLHIERILGWSVRLLHISYQIMESITESWLFNAYYYYLLSLLYSPTEWLHMLLMLTIFCFLELNLYIYIYAAILHILQSFIMKELMPKIYWLQWNLSTHHAYYSLCLCVYRLWWR